jgi:hypothetical protein
LVLTTSSSGTFTQSAPVNGVLTYIDDFGSFSFGGTATFTVTNNGPGTSEPLSFLNGNPGFPQISNDLCTGATLTDGGSCTFNINWTIPSPCQRTSNTATESTSTARRQT